MTWKRLIFRLRASFLRMDRIMPGLAEQRAEAASLARRCERRTGGAIQVEASPVMAASVRAAAVDMPPVVLLIEANDTARTALATAISELGIRVIRQTDAKDAANICRRRAAPISAVLVGSLAPNEAPWQVLHALRDPTLPHRIPVLLLSAGLSVRPDALPVCLEFDQVLPLPVELERLARELTRLLDQKILAPCMPPISEMMVRQCQAT